MSLTVKPSDYQFEVQGTKYFMRFEMDSDIGEVFVAAIFDDVAQVWTGFIFNNATQFAVDQHGGIPEMMQFFIDKVNTVLEENHGTPPTDTLLGQEQAFLSNNVILVNERLELKE